VLLGYVLTPYPGVCIILAILTDEPIVDYPQRWIRTLSEEYVSFEGFTSSKGRVDITKCATRGKLYHLTRHYVIYCLSHVWEATLIH
jgi:hypothetical protein